MVRRELERQFDTVLFERVVLSPAKVSPLVRQIHPEAASVFKDSYLVEFLDLPATHLERDLRRGLMAQLRQFLLELGATSVLWAVNTPAGSGAQRKHR
jgi:predicted nuclease of restriction endonuclease-like (RecB) superfamily